MLQSLKQLLQIRSSKQHIQGLHSAMNDRLNAFRQDRSPEAQRALNGKFKAVLRAWGIKKTKLIPRVIEALYLRCMVFSLAILFSLVAAFFLQSFVAYISLVFFLLPCLLGLVTSLWRISILKHRRFIPFSRWIVSLVYPINNKGNMSC